MPGRELRFPREPMTNRIPTQDRAGASSVPACSLSAERALTPLDGASTAGLCACARTGDGRGGAAPRREGAKRGRAQARCALADGGGMRRTRRLSVCLGCGRRAHSPGKARNGDADSRLPAHLPAKGANGRRQKAQVSGGRSQRSLMGPRERGHGCRSAALAPTPLGAPRSSPVHVSWQGWEAGLRPRRARGPAGLFSALALVRKDCPSLDLSIPCRLRTRGAPCSPAKSQLLLKILHLLSLPESLSPSFFMRNYVLFQLKNQ